jgi:DNA-binding transcriptional ArsR family regulator
MTERRAATVEELKALAHPLRLRILRLCLDRARTNQELAERLQLAPGSVLRHVRVLTHTGLLRAEEPRQGPRGAIERPYRATGLSWYLSLEDASPEMVGRTELAMVDAYRAELAERLRSGADVAPESMRTTVWLRPDDRAELARRVVELVREYDDPHGPGTERHSYLWSMHVAPDEE